MLKHRGLLYITIKNMYVSLISVPIGVLIFRLKFYERNTNCIIVCNHIGDAVITAGYLKAYKELHSDKKLTVIIHKKFDFLFKQYEKNIDNMVMLDASSLRKLEGISRTNWGQHAAEKYHMIVATPTNDVTSREYGYLMKYPDQSLVSCIKYGVLGLDKKSEFQRWTDDKDDGALNNYDILIIPDTNTTRKIDMSFYRKIAEKLIGLGYKIYINNECGTNDSIKGAIPLDVSLNELAEQSRIMGHVIGARSGALDLLCYTSKHVLALYDDKKEMDFFGLGHLENKISRIDEVLLSGDNQKDIERIINTITGKDNRE